MQFNAETLGEVSEILQLVDMFKPILGQVTDLVFDGYEGLLESVGPDNPMAVRARNRLVRLYESTGRESEAAALDN